MPQAIEENFTSDDRTLMRFLINFVQIPPHQAEDCVALWRPTYLGLAKKVQAELLSDKGLSAELVAEIKSYELK